MAVLGWLVRLQLLDQSLYPEDDDLYVEFSTGCVTDDAVPGLRDDLTKLAAAMGVR